jgi:nucleoside 2-deoxyribosyltransferase
MLATAPRAELEPFAAGRKPVIYLAGAIDKVPPEFALAWRRQATEALQDKYKILDPTADKDLFLPGVNTDYFTPQQIVDADLTAIMSSDIVLAEISRKDIPYHGTSQELVYAYNWQKVIYVWGGCKSYWIRYHATQIFDGLPEAIDHLLYS